jgi:predicted Zn-dependent protease
MGRILIALVIAAFSIISFLGSREYNPVTGEDQYVGLTENQEIALGLQSEPEMIRQYGGLMPDQQVQDAIDSLGLELVQESMAAGTNWQFDFHVLDDPDTVNAFALPGGPVFITSGLLSRLETEGQAAGVLGHEIGHVLARHSAQQIAKSDLTDGLLGAVMVASENSAQTAAIIAQLVNMRYGREDELESDRLGVRIMSGAGYDPRSLIGVMEILAQASGGAQQPEFFSTHPNPENRIQQIQAAIQAEFPNGVPDNLIE